MELNFYIILFACLVAVSFICLRMIDKKNLGDMKINLDKARRNKKEYEKLRRKLRFWYRLSYSFYFIERFCTWGLFISFYVELFRVAGWWGLFTILITVVESFLLFLKYESLTRVMEVNKNVKKKANN